MNMQTIHAGRWMIMQKSRLDELQTHVDLLDAAMQAAEPANLASLTKERRATLAEIAELEAEAPPEVSLSDQLAAKRAAKVSGPPPADRRGQPRRSNGSHRTG